MEVCPTEKTELREGSTGLSELRNRPGFAVKLSLGLPFAVPLAHRPISEHRLATDKVTSPQP
jgi:hypothetical protein